MGENARWCICPSRAFVWGRDVTLVPRETADPTIACHIFRFLFFESHYDFCAYLTVLCTLLSA